MAKSGGSARKVRDIEERSKHWSPEDLIRNLDEEMSRLEQGLCHMIYDNDDKRVSAIIRPLPVTPRFDLKETDEEVTLSVTLPSIPRENVRLNVEKNSIEIFACSNDLVCRPHYLSVDSANLLDPDSAKAEMVDGVVKVSVRKARKKRLKVD